MSGRSHIRKGAGRAQCLAFGLAGVMGLLAQAPAGVAIPAVTGRSMRVAPASSAAGALSDWTQDHFDPAHSGSNPYEHIRSPANVSGLVPKWAINEPLFVRGTVVVAHGIVYVGGADASNISIGRVFAWEAQTGQEVWEAVQPDGGAVRASACAAGWSSWASSLRRLTPHERGASFGR
jgi:outer membrane protein assembly factor BamB